MRDQSLRFLSFYLEPISAYFKLTNTLWQLQVQPKDKVEKGKVVSAVYHITCDDCDATYVRDSERALKTQFLEHWRTSSVGHEVSQHVHVDRLEYGVSLEHTSSTGQIHK